MELAQAAKVRSFLPKSAVSAEGVARTGAALIMAPKAANGKLPMMPAPSPQRPKREPKANEGDSNSQSGIKREAEGDRPKRVVKPKVIKEADTD